MRKFKGSTSCRPAIEFIGFLAFCNVALAGLTFDDRESFFKVCPEGPKHQEQSKERPVALSKIMSFGNRLRLARSQGSVATGLPTVSLEIYFDFNSAIITEKAEPALRELGAALSDPRLQGTIVSINGHTSASEGDGFNTKLSERRAVTIKGYLVDTFQISPDNLRTVGYGKTRPILGLDVNHPANRRVEIVNLSAEPGCEK
jgi:outer membrane protein OmpA-like peptidoglycan-associated protein